MDLSVYHKDFTQHDLFGLFPGAPSGRALVPASCGQYTRRVAPPDFSLPCCKHLVHAHAEAVEQS
jgi:hypothetical protein